MTDIFLPPPEHVSPPRQALPAGAVDCHAHIFGPFSRFPLAEARPYTPAELPVERYLSMLDEIGCARGVLVQPVAHGTDCRALLDALERHPARLRGVALLTSDVTDDELQLMHRCGIRGARFSAPPPGYTIGAVGFEVLRRLAPKLARLGWHAQIWAPGDELHTVVPELHRLGVPLVVDHFGSVDVSRGLQDPAFQGLLRFLHEGSIWLKLVAYRMSRTPPRYEDLEPFHRAFVAANPERLLWGSDWPHPHLKQDMPDVGRLLDLFDSGVPNDTVRRRILVDNPTLLYGF